MKKHLKAIAGWIYNRMVNLEGWLLIYLVMNDCSDGGSALRTFIGSHTGVFWTHDTETYIDFCVKGLRLILVLLLKREFLLQKLRNTLRKLSQFCICAWVMVRRLFLDN